MKIAVIHPTGNQFVRALIMSLQQAGMLAKFTTTVAVEEDNYWMKLLPEKMKKEFGRRIYPLHISQIDTRPLLELARNILPKLGLNYMVRNEYGFASLDKIYADLDRSVAKGLEKNQRKSAIDAVYAYEDGALHTFFKAKEMGLKCVYDLPIAYWEAGSRLMEEEAVRLPAWAVTLGGGINDSEEKRERKTKELELADAVVVPGKFVAASLPEWAKHKQIILAPFGSPDPGNFSIAEKDKNKRLRVLFVGSMGQRKGLGDLFEAVKMIDPEKIELVVMGNLLASMEFYRNELCSFIFEKVRPHDQVLELMRTCDVFCLPSIVEGRALVMQEAMSQGLPLIITPNTGGEDLIVEQQTGFLVPLRSPAAIAEKLTWFIENPTEIRRMGFQAKAHAANYTWKGYGELIIKELTKKDV